jgi:predicted RND superfamily exporter protein
MPPRFLEILRSIALVGARRPFVALAISLAIVAASAALIPGLKISTSRRALVDEHDPLQQRSLDFDRRFGYTASPAVVLTGGSAEERRKLVDALTRELEALPELKDRVLGRVGPDEVAEVLLLQDPARVRDALGRLGEPGTAAVALESGLVGWAGLLGDQVARGLEQGEGSAEDAAKGLDGLTSMVAALDAELAGGGGLSRLGTSKDASARGDAKDAAATPFEGVDDQGYLADHAGHHLLLLYPPLEGDEGWQVRPTIDRVRAARDRAIRSAAVPVDAHVTGLPAIVADELRTVERDLAVTSLASSVALLLTLYWGFRSFRQALVSFLPLGFGTIVTFGITRLALGKLNLITASFTSVLLGLGDFGVHIQTRYSELLRKGIEPREAMPTAMLRAAPGLLVGTLTTAVAFLTTTVTEFTAFAELGFITSVGLVVMLAGTYLLVPSSVLLLLGATPRPSPEIAGFRTLARLVRTYPRAIVAAAVAITVVFATIAPKARYNGRYFEFLPRDAESSKGLVELARDPLANPIVANASTKTVEEARARAAALRALPSVGLVESPSDLLPPLDEPRKAALVDVLRLLEREGKPADFRARQGQPVDREALGKALEKLSDNLDEVAFGLRQAGRDAAAADRAKQALAQLRERVAKVDAARLVDVESRALRLLDRAQATARAVVARGGYAPSDLPPLFARRFTSRDGQELALFLHPAGDIWEVEVARQFVREVSAVCPDVNGIAATLAEHPTMIVSGFARATVLACVLVLVILFVSFRRPSDVAIAVVPLVLGTIWMVGSMAPLDLQLNHANIVVLPLLLGLGVDASAHIMARYQQSREEHGGVAKIDDMLANTGGAVFVAGLTTVFGFSAMMLADYRAMFSLGLLMTIGMSATFAMSLVVLPALLVLLRRAD